MTSKEESEEALTRKWIKEAGTEYPGDKFQLAILKKINELQERKNVYQPVISPLGWKLILIYVACIVGLSIFSNPNQPSSFALLEKLPPLRLPKFQLNLPELPIGWPDFSPQFSMGIMVFLGLGFVMILINLKSKQASL